MMFPKRRLKRLRTTVSYVENNADLLLKIINGVFSAILLVIIFTRPNFTLDCRFIVINIRIERVQ